MVDPKPRLKECLKRLKLPTFASQVHNYAGLATNEGWPYDRFLLELSELEISERQTRRVQRLLQDSRLPRAKTSDSFDKSRLKLDVVKKWELLKTGEFLQRRENVMAFGNPGSGKTHLLCALGHELVSQGRAIYFTSCALLVQRLLKAKAQLHLEKELKRLDKYEGLILDDLGYVQQSREEMEVLFTLLAHRYEHRSIMITSNLVFSDWERIFKDPMTTAAAIDRLVHHSVILELNLPSYRMETAKANQHEVQEEEKA